MPFITSNLGKNIIKKLKTDKLKVAFLYIAVGSIYILALMERPGEIINPANTYLFATFSFILFIVFASFYLIKRIPVNGLLPADFLLLIIILAILTFTSKYKHDSIEETYKFLSAVLISIVIANSAEDKEHKEKFVKSIFYIGILLSFISYIFYILPPGSKLAIIAAKYNFASNNAITSIWGYQNVFAGFLNAPVFIAFGLLLEEQHRDKKTLIGFAIVFMIFTLFLTTSRGAYISAILAFIIFLVLSEKRDIPKILTYAGIIVPSAYALALISSPQIILTNLKKTNTLIKYIEGKPNSSLWMRVHLAHLSLKILLKQPFYGSGLGTFRYMFCKNEWIWNPWIRSDPHSFIFRIIAETGILGTITIFFTILKRLSIGIKRMFVEKRSFLRRGVLAGTFAIFFHMCMDTDSQRLIILVIFFSLLAIIQANKKFLKGKNFYRLSIIVLILTLVMSLTIDLVPKDIASLYALMGDATSSNSLSLKYYSYASKFDPKNALYPYYIANTERNIFYKTHNKSILDSIILHYKKAERLNPLDYRYPLDIGLIYLENKNPLSIKYIKKAESLYPTAPFIKGWIAISYLYTENNNNEAINYIKKSTNINKQDLNAAFANGMIMIGEENAVSIYRYFTNIAVLESKELNSFVKAGIKEDVVKKSDCLLRWSILIELLKEKHFSKEYINKIKQLENYFLRSS